MRKIFMALAVASIFTACNSKSKTEETNKNVMSVDTSNLYNSGVYTDTGSLSEAPETAPAITPKKAVSVKPVVRAPKSSAPSNTSTNNENSGTVKDSAATGGTAASTSAQAEKKKGMSSATKGAVIGGVGGAVGGAIISKKKGKGAIIGGAVGAAGGYILGRKKDRKNQVDTTK